MSRAVPTRVPCGGERLNSVYKRAAAMVGRIPWCERDAPRASAVLSLPLVALLATSLWPPRPVAASMTPASRLGVGAFGNYIGASAQTPTPTATATPCGTLVIIALGRCVDDGTTPCSNDTDCAGIGNGHCTGVTEDDGSIFRAAPSSEGYPPTSGGTYNEACVNPATDSEICAVTNLDIKDVVLKAAGVLGDNYFVSTTLTRFPTTGNPVLAGGIACRAELHLEFDSMGAAPGRSLIAEYCTAAWPIGTEDWTASTGMTAIPGGRVPLDDPAPEGPWAISLDSSTGISAAADVGFCFGIDGGEPTGLMGTSFTSFDTTAAIPTPTGIPLPPVVPPQLWVWVAGNGATASPSATPTATPCGDGVVEWGEQCDDGNTDDDDCCSSACQYESAGSLCEGTNLCNSGECDGVGACVPQVRTNCRAAGKSTLLIRNPSDSNKGKLLWKWLKGAATMLAEFGTPSTTTEYALCVYSGTSAAAIVDAEIAPSGTLWTPRGTTGLKYRDPTRSSDGIQKVILESGAAGNAKALVRGRGPGLPAPPAGPFTLPVTAQLVNSDNNACFEGTYGLREVVKNETDQFKARAH